MEQEARSGYRANTEVLEQVATRLRGVRSLRDGDIVLRLSGDGAGGFCLRCGPTGVEIVESAGAGVDRPPLVEIIGDAEIVRSVLNGKKDARKQFLTGHFRLRGDLRYASDLGMELGLLREPL